MRQIFPHFKNRQLGFTINFFQMYEVGAVKMHCHKDKEHCYKPLIVHVKKLGLYSVIIVVISLLLIL